MSRIDQQKAAIREFTRVFKNEHDVEAIDHLSSDRTAICAMC